MGKQLKRFLGTFILFLSLLPSMHAGDDASGKTPCSVDLSRAFTTYAMTPKDREWSRRLTRKFKYKGRVIHFVQTSLPLEIGNRVVEGAVYQSLEKPDFFYVVDGDVMLRLGKQWAYSPGVGGFSMHAPKSRKFIVSLNFVEGGVPFLSSSRVKKGIVSWDGDPEWNRLR